MDTVASIEAAVQALYARGDQQADVYLTALKQSAGTLHPQLGACADRQYTA